MSKMYPTRVSIFQLRRLMINRANTFSTDCTLESINHWRRIPTSTSEGCHRWTGRPRYRKCDTLWNTHTNHTWKDRCNESHWIPYHKQFQHFGWLIRQTEIKPSRCYRLNILGATKVANHPSEELAVFQLSFDLKLISILFGWYSFQWSIYHIDSTIRNQRDYLSKLSELYVTVQTFLKSLHNTCVTKILLTLHFIL